MNTCHGCGTEKDPNVLEVYPYPEDDDICEDPIPPFFPLDVQPQGGSGWRKATVCHECFHRLEPDMWINQRMWEGLNPTTTFDDLPLL
jgi:hypothetical protein